MSDTTYMVFLLAAQLIFYYFQWLSLRFLDKLHAFPDSSAITNSKSGCSLELQSIVRYEHFTSTTRSGILRIMVTWYENSSTFATPCSFLLWFCQYLSHVHALQVKVLFLSSYWSKSPPHFNNKGLCLVLLWKDRECSGRYALALSIL